MAADLTAPAAARQAVQDAAGMLGGLDVFVHAVGVNDRRPVLQTPRRDLGAHHRRQPEERGVERAGRGRADGAGHGRIVFLSSVSGLLAHADHAPYAATKGGVNQLCRVMAREWAPHGVTVNAVAPGYTETELTSAYLDKPGVKGRHDRLVPAGRLGTAGDLVGPVLFLCSAQSAFVTGHVMYVDGGRTLV